MKVFLILSVGFYLLGCVSVNPRQPNSEPTAPTYSYKPHLQCEAKNQMTPEAALPRWSPLSGYAVGPSQNSQFKSAEDKILRPFTSDGCSSSPDGTPGASDTKHWAACCVAHDTAYWLGGSQDEKIEADEKLEQCIAYRGYPKIGNVYKVFVKQFGGPRSSQSFRWGYGWNYKRDFGPLTADEEQQVRKLYGANSDTIKKDLESLFHKLTVPCETYDTGLQKISADENKIYVYLNSHLKKDTVIEWIRLSDTNLERTTYFVKLAGCQDPIGFVFSKKTKSIQNVRMMCSDL